MKKEEIKRISEGEEQKFSLVSLRNNSISLFGVTSSTFDAVVSSITDREYSISEMKKIIKDWLGKEAK